MYMSMLGAAAFMNWKGGLKTSQGMFWFGVGGIVGWPFAAALCAPFLVEELILLFMSDSERVIESLHRLTRGVLGPLVAGVSIHLRVNLRRWKLNRSSSSKC
jgi:alpha-1,2-mannosyltransferase